MDLTPEQVKAGRRWAYVVMLTMLALSIAGNLSHTFLKNPTAGMRAQTYAVMWPLLVWAGVELFVRIPWRKEPVHHAVRWFGVLIPAGVAGLVSYNHLSGLLKADREDWVVYTLGPLAVDGLMLMSTLGLLLTRSIATKTEKLPLETVSGDDAFRAQIAALEMQLAARDNAPFAEPVPPVSETHFRRDHTWSAPAPDTDGLVLPEPTPLAGWSAAQTKTSGRTPKYDVAKAKAQLHAGVPKDEIAGVAGVHVKTITRLRAAMIKAGELTA